jgi:hypothetical protein
MQVFPTLEVLILKSDRVLTFLLGFNKSLLNRSLPAKHFPCERWTALSGRLTQFKVSVRPEHGKRSTIAFLLNALSSNGWRDCAAYLVCWLAVTPNQSLERLSSFVLFIVSATIKTYSGLVSIWEGHLVSLLPLLLLRGLLHTHQIMTITKKSPSIGSPVCNT